MKVKKMIAPIARGAWNPEDTNNCTVRALANATDMSIVEATELMAKHGRQRNKGTWNFHKPYVESGLELIGVYGTTSQSRMTFHNSVYGEKAHMNQSYHEFLKYKKKGISLEKFIEEHQEGSYIVIVRGHALAIIDGEVVYSHPTSGAKSVNVAYKVVK